MKFENLQSLTSILKTHISKNEIKEMLEVLNVFLGKCNSSLQQDLIILSNRFHALNAQIRQGTLEESQKDIVRNNLIARHFNTITVEYRGPPPYVRGNFKGLPHERCRAANDLSGRLYATCLFGRQRATDDSAEPDCYACYIAHRVSAQSQRHKH